jgi:hypothetical protein
VPSDKCSIAVNFKFVSSDPMSLKVEVIADGRINGCKFLQTSFEPEPGHGTLSSPKWEMGILSAIVFPIDRLPGRLDCQ